MTRVSRFVKLFFYSTFIFLLLFIAAIIHDSRKRTESDYGDNILLQMDFAEKDVARLAQQKVMKYILLWTGYQNSAFEYMGKGQQGFIDNQCPVNNCFVTSDRNMLSGDYTAFDAVAFFGPQLVRTTTTNLPSKRSPQQKYIFSTFESADNYPICSKQFDGFFNWTWTYKLDSDARWGYIVVRDDKGDIVGPQTDMHWIKEMEPVGEELKIMLKSKKKAAAWFVSNCHSRSGREQFVKDVQKHLKPFGLSVDVYGRCGTLQCPRDKMEDCLKKLENDYYFYFAFENSFSEDYVTEKLIHALQYNTVPVVYGGANYTRFMPDGMYLNARDLGAEGLASAMHDIISDPERYHSFFRYKRHYSFWRRMQHVQTNDYCQLCAMLNDQTLVGTTSVYEDFREWWNTKNRCPGLN